VGKQAEYNKKKGGDKNFPSKVWRFPTCNKRSQEFIH